MAILLPLKYGKETQKHLSSSLLQFAANKQTKATGREPFVPIKLSDSVHLLNEWRNAALILNEALQQSKTDELLSDITKNIQFNTMIKQTIRAGNVFLIAKNQNPFSGTSSVQWERTNQIQGSTPAFNSLPSGKHILGSCTKVSGELPPPTTPSEELQTSYKGRKLPPPLCFIRKYTDSIHTRQAYTGFPLPEYLEDRWELPTAAQKQGGSPRSALKTGQRQIGKSRQALFWLAIKTSQNG